MLADCSVALKVALTGAMWAANAWMDGLRAVVRVDATVVLSVDPLADLI